MVVHTSNPNYMGGPGWKCKRPYLKN
jgi:hypothetical protein